MQQPKSWLMGQPTWSGACWICAITKRNLGEYESMLKVDLHLVPDLIEAT